VRSRVASAHAYLCVLTPAASMAGRRTAMEALCCDQGEVAMLSWWCYWCLLLHRINSPSQAGSASKSVEFLSPYMSIILTRHVWIIITKACMCCTSKFKHCVQYRVHTNRRVDRNLHNVGHAHQSCMHLCLVHGHIRSAPLGPADSPMTPVTTSAADTE